MNWAVHEALLTARDVVVVHESLRDCFNGGAGQQGASRAEAPVKSHMEAAVRVMTERFPDLGLTTALESDDPAAGLKRWSAVADILVVGSPATWQQRQLGSLPQHVAAAADSPVAWIPGGWQPTSETTSLVVVGATSTPAGRAAVRFAAGEAAKINATLLAVVGAQRLSSDGRAILAHFDELAVAEPRLTIEVDWVDGDAYPAENLIDRSRAAQLLVVGAHHSADRWSIRLGPVTGAVLRRAHCPVVTVARLHSPTSPRPTATDPAAV